MYAGIRRFLLLLSILFVWSCAGKSLDIKCSNPSLQLSLNDNSSISIIFNSSCNFSLERYYEKDSIKNSKHGQVYNNYKITAGRGILEKVDINTDMLADNVFSHADIKDNGIVLNFFYNGEMKQLSGNEFIYLLDNNSEIIPQKKAEFIKKVECSTDKLLKVYGDGALIHDFGKLKNGLYYFDLLNVKLSNDFIMFKECNVSGPVILPYPERVRFLINSREKYNVYNYLNVSGLVKGKSEVKYNNYVIKAEEKLYSKNQTINLIFSNKDIKLNNNIKHIERDLQFYKSADIVVELSGVYKPVKELESRINFKGEYIKSAEIKYNIEKKITEIRLRRANIVKKGFLYIYSTGEKLIIQTGSEKNKIAQVES